MSAVPRVNWIRRLAGRYSARKIFYPRHPANTSAAAAAGWNESITVVGRRLPAGSGRAVPVGR